MPLYGKKKFNVINRHEPRVDGYAKATGRAFYAGDLSRPHMLYGGMLRSQFPSAEIKKIDTTKAKAIPGVEAVLTYADIPAPKTWSNYMYITDKVRYVGDVVAIVAATSKELVDEALEAIEVEYEEVPGVFTIEEALKEGAPLVHEEYPGNIFKESVYHLRKGDVDLGFKDADVIIERKYESQYVEHSYMEPEACLAEEDRNDGVMTVYASAQSPFFTRRYIAHALQVPIKDVRLVQQTIGGTFGGKEEAIGLLSGRAALLAKATRRPVKMVMKREESFLESAKRHPFIFKYKVGAKKTGEIVALEGELIDNSGAYNNQTQFMNWRANVHSAGPYVIPHVKTDTYGVFTNNIHSGAFRGYSSPQLIWAQEQLIDELGEELGLNPVQMRRINCLKSGTLTATSQKLDEVLFDEMLDVALEQTNFETKYISYPKETHPYKKKGIGLALAYRGSGLGGEGVDSSGAQLTANEDGTVLLNTGLAENGQGLKTVFSQIAAEALGVTLDRVRFYGTDTHSATDSGMTVASRSSAMGSRATKLAGESLKRRMLENAIELQIFELDGKKLQVTMNDLPKLDLINNVITHRDYPEWSYKFEDLCNTCLWAGKKMSVFEWFDAKADDLVFDHHTTQGKVFPNYAYGVVIAEVEVDIETGFVEVTHVTASHDVGTVINESLAKGQIYGGIVMGMGYAVTEEMEVKNGYVKQHNFDSYILPSVMDRPKMDINLFESTDESGSYQAKSLGEPATEAVAAAIANAVAHATQKRTRLNPANLETVLLGKKL